MKVLEFCKSEYECDDGGCCVIGALCRTAKVDIGKSLNDEHILELGYETEKLMDYFHISNNDLFIMQTLNDNGKWNKLFSMLKNLKLVKYVQKFGKWIEVPTGG